FVVATLAWLIRLAWDAGSQRDLLQWYRQGISVHQLRRCAFHRRPRAAPAGLTQSVDAVVGREPDDVLRHVVPRRWSKLRAVHRPRPRRPPPRPHVAATNLHTRPSVRRKSRLSLAKRCRRAC